MRTSRLGHPLPALPYFSVDSNTRCNHPVLSRTYYLRNPASITFLNRMPIDKEPSNVVRKDLCAGRRVILLSCDMRLPTRLSGVYSCKHWSPMDKRGYAMITSKLSRVLLT